MSTNPIIGEILKKYGEGRDVLWDVQGTTVIKHAALERVATKAGIQFEQPLVVEANGKDKCVALCVTGRMGEHVEWSFGESAPYNTRDVTKQGKPMATYPYAMAEKRAKDRVILKLIGLHGMVYSEEEADDFKNGERPGGIQPGTMAPTNGDDARPAGKRVADMTVAKLKEAYTAAMKEIEAAEGDIGVVAEMVKAHASVIEQTIRTKPMWWTFKDEPAKGMKNRILAVIAHSDLKDEDRRPAANLRAWLDKLEAEANPNIASLESNTSEKEAA